MDMLTLAIQKYSSKSYSSTYQENIPNISDSDLSNIAEILEVANQQGDSLMKNIFHAKTKITTTLKSEPRTI